jgi:hypothetical protein
VTDVVNASSPTPTPASGSAGGVEPSARRTITPVRNTGGFVHDSVIDVALAVACRPATGAGGAGTPSHPDNTAATMTLATTANPAA